MNSINKKYSTTNKEVLINQIRIANEPHPFHLVEPSPWPLATSVSLLILTLATVLKLHGRGNTGPIIIAIIGLLTCMMLWWRDTIRESTYQGAHTLFVQKGLKLGFIVFVISEVLFFFSIFWAFFHSSLSPSIELGCMWPPKGIESLNPKEIPLLNTIILLSSGATATYAHSSLRAGKYKETTISLMATILLALVFTFLQGFEYINAPFTFADGVYGSCFYFSTGFHGIHVFIGTIFLFVSLYRIYTYQSTESHHVGFESAIIYWHFVDIVWLFLFTFVYWWAA